MRLDESVLRDKEEIVIWIAWEWRCLDISEDVGMAQHKQAIFVLGQEPRVCKRSHIVENRREIILHRSHEIMRACQKFRAEHEAR